jgi:HAD superfamily hydrolase (TIGR01549 family)
MHRPIDAVLFDMDGVLVHSPLDLVAIKNELFGDSAVFIIEGLDALPSDERKIKDALLMQRELEAAHQAKLAPGVLGLFGWLEKRGIKRGVITRNSRDVVKAIAEKLGIDFGAVVGREDAPAKPDPESVYTACRMLDVRPEQSVMVGDYVFDIEAGRRAGCRTVFLETETFRHLNPEADVRIKSLNELREILESWLGEECHE